MWETVKNDIPALQKIIKEIKESYPEIATLVEEIKVDHIQKGRENIDWYNNQA